MKLSFLMVATASLAVGLVGCADLQHQASGYLPGATQQPTQAQAVAYEGGQQVQYIPGTGQSGSASNRSNAASNTQEDSLVGDMMKSATDSFKSEATSGIRSAVRGMFSR